MPRDYQGPRRERETLTRLLFPLGLSDTETARMVECNPITYRKDVKAFGLNRAQRPKTKEARYAAAVKLYAELNHRRPVGLDDDNRNTIHNALKEHLKIMKLLAYLRGVETGLTLLTLTSGDDTSGQRRSGEWRLVREIFGQNSAMPSASGWMNVALERIASGEAPPPQSHEEFTQMILEEARRKDVEEARRLVRPAWSEEREAEFKETVCQALATLTPREERVIRERFGFNGPRRTLEEIARELGVIRERVRQIEAKALHLLRSPSMSERFRPFIQPLVEQVRDLEEENEHLRAKTAEVEKFGAFWRQVRELVMANESVATKNFNPNLFKRCDKLELSVRTENCLTNAGIKFVWQLVEKTEAEMLKTKNFGHKSLNEVKDLLDDLGLQLGMKLGPNFPRRPSVSPPPSP